MEFNALNIILKLAAPLGPACWKRVKQLKPIEQVRINWAIESAIAEVWESLDGYLASERADDRRRAIVATACEAELRPYAEDVSLLLKASLDGDKLFEKVRAEKGAFPQEIRDEGLEQVYRMVFPLIASVLCKAPVIVEQVEENSVAEVLSRFDQLRSDLGKVSAGITQLRREPEQRADDLFERVLELSVKRVLLQLEVSGLYNDKPLKQAKEDMFVLPAIEEEIPSDEGLEVHGAVKDNEKPKPRIASLTEDHERLFLAEGLRGVVRGAPGAGKSTWSRWLQSHAMREKRLLSLHLRLRACQGGRVPTVREMIAELVGENMAAEIDAKAVARWIENKTLAVFVDGFDEVAPEHRDVMRRAILELSYYLQSCPLLVTSRPLSPDHLKELPDPWVYWTILPFDEDRICDYITRWYRNAPLKEGASREVDAPALYKLLCQDPHVQPLTSNPLMLATLLMVHHNDGDLPKGRSRLYARYIDGMLGIWDDKKEVLTDQSGLDREKKKRILTSFAIELQYGDEDERDENATLAIVQQALSDYGYKADAQAVLDSLRERSGLIVGPGSYSFSHRSVGEYLVAQAICDGDRKVRGEKLDRFTLLRERHNDRWLNVLYFWAGSTGVAEVQAFIEELDRTKYDNRLRLGLLWDQMDRFQKQWFSAQLIASLESMIELDPGQVGMFVSPRFDAHREDAVQTRTENGVVWSAPVRHVSHEVLEGDLIQSMLDQAGIPPDFSATYSTPALRNTICRHLMDSEDPEVLLSFAQATPFPLWFRKARIARKYLKNPDLLPKWRDWFPDTTPHEAQLLMLGIVAFGSIRATALSRAAELAMISWTSEELTMSNYWSEARRDGIMNLWKRLLSLLDDDQFLEAKHEHNAEKVAKLRARLEDLQRQSEALVSHSPSSAP